MVKRIEEPEKLKGLRWRPTGLMEEQQQAHQTQLEAQRKEDADLEAVATEALATKTPVVQKE